MSALPYPEAMRAAFAATAATNRSLLFHRYFASYDESWRILEEDRKHHIPDGKLQFFEAFLKAFEATAEDDFDAFVFRRRRAMAALSATRTCVRSTSRLVIGLGLPHPTETCLLLDRLTGCPYLPGSSVKGMLREAARLATAGELGDNDTAAQHWAPEGIRRVFGPAAAAAGSPAEGEATFYDAFPASWPGLKLDVLTPHYSAYYGDRTGKIAPGDWEDPKPVRFLTVAPGNLIEIYFRCTAKDAAHRAEDEAALRWLLPVALSQLGIGGKKSSGYGAFELVACPHGSPPRQAAQSRPPSGAPAGRPGTLPPVAPHPQRQDRARRPADNRSAGEAALPRPPRQETRDEAHREVVMLAALPQGGKAPVTTEDGATITCKDVGMYPVHKVGDRLRATVTRKAGVALHAQFKGWL